MLKLLRVRINGGSLNSPSWIHPEQIQETLQDAVPDSEVIRLCERRDTLNKERNELRGRSRTGKARFSGRYTVVDEEGFEVEL